jgi:serine/threonine protein kinase
MTERASDPSATGAYAATGPAVGAVFAGRYKLRELLGEGGMGSVYAADQIEPVQRRVALKLIRTGHDSAYMLGRFEQERQALALMDHPNIAKVFDAGIADEPRTTGSGGTPYFAMELIRGVPITRYCDEAKLTPRQRLELFIPVCQAVQHAHQKGIIHRDLKPTNVLVGLYDSRPVPKVIDFGVAKATGPRLTEKSIYTEIGSLVGTLEYMAPEQAELNNLDIDTRADVYALGVILYELLTGTVPFSRKELQSAGFVEMLRLIREVEPPKPSTKISGSGTLPSVAANRGLDPRKLTQQLRGELDWIALKCLEKERSRRYETANQLALEVQRFLADEPVEACPPSATYRLRKFARKNRAALTTAAVIAMLLVGGVTVSTWQAIRATRAETAALTERDEKEKALAAEANQRLMAENAAAAEKTAKEQTQKRLAQIEKGVDLFAGMLRGINPRAEEQVGEPLYVQLRQRAEQAADAMDAEAVGDPLAVARLQTILGNTLRELGSAAKAVEVLEKARAIRERELGADHPSTLVTLDNLASAYRVAGRLPEAVALHEQVRDAQVKKLGADDPDTLATLHNLALAYGVAGRLPEAVALHEQVRDARVKKLGADDPDTLATLNNLASAYGAAGRLPEAVALHERVRDARVKKLGADHPSTLVTLNNLAFAYQTAGRLPEAVALYEQVRDAQVKKLGADHPSTLTTLNNLARAYQVAEKLPEAIALFEQAATGIARRRFQHEHAGLIIPNTITAYEQAEQLDKAEGWRRQWLAVVKRQAGAESPPYAGELAALGNNLLRQKKWSEAETDLREGLVIREKKQPDAWTTFNTRSLLGGALLGQKKYADAEPLLLNGYEGLKQREDQIPKASQIRLIEALERLVQFYAATGPTEKADAWRSKLDEAKAAAALPAKKP